MPARWACFFTSIQIVDWYHAKQHLWQTANLLHKEGSPAAKAWVKAHETPLYEGHAERIATTILAEMKLRRKIAAKLEDQAIYFSGNARRMQYLERREQDYPLGSGTAESGCKQYRARFAGPGMRWSRSGAERLLPIRTAIMSRRFDDFWQGLQLVH